MGVLAVLHGSATGLAISSFLDHAYALKMPWQVEAIQLRSEIFEKRCLCLKVRNRLGEVRFERVVLVYYIFDRDMFLYQALS